METCGFCGKYADGLRLRKDFYRATNGGIICEANLVCQPCNAEAERVDAVLESRGLMAEVGNG